MSTFEGRVREMPGVSVDRFDGENLSSSAYFLTHLHTDHTQGLSVFFFKRLQERKVYFYCSRLTKLFLQKRYYLCDGSMTNVKELTPCSPIILEYTYGGERETIVVTCLPAGHCPGSLMYIFQSNDARVLCTGDFRIAPGDLPKFKALNSEDGGKITPLKFDNIYLDTTFLNPDYSHFPTRQETLDEICRRSVEWIARDARYVVSIECPALYGSEFVLMELWDKLGERIHVKPRQFVEYSNIQELSAAVTDEPGATRVHACASKCFTRHPLPCRSEIEDKYVLTIVISAQRWKNRSSSDKISEWDERRKNRLHVCGAMHPSYNEIKAFLDYFQPLRVHPCVDPPIDCKVSAQDLLNELRRRETASVDYDLSSLLESPTEREKIRSVFFTDDTSD